MRPSLRLGLGVVALCLPAWAACGGSGTPAPDAKPPLTNIGFTLPTKATHANMPTATDKVFTDLGLADWSCLNTPSTDAPLAQDLTLMVHTQSFQPPNPIVPNGAVDVFSDIDYTHPFKTTTSDGSGNVTVTIPAGKTRVGFKVKATDYFDTFLLNQYWAPSSTTATLDVGVISSGLATALPAFIDFERVQGTGVLAGAMRDCAHHEVSNAIATVSSTPMTATHLTGTVQVGTTPTDVIASSFYFAATTTGLPAKHKDVAATTEDGLFVVFNLPPISGTAYIQVWGFKTDADVALGQAGLTLLAELQSPVLADNVITGSIEPLRK